jgi:hypothetical protein
MREQQSGSRVSGQGPVGQAELRRIRRLKTPRPVEVEVDEEGTPLRLRLDGAWQDVTPARDCWRIDQHWWRHDGAVSRIYFRLLPLDSPPVTIYRDLLGGGWFRQEY